MINRRIKICKYTCRINFAGRIQPKTGSRQSFLCQASRRRYNGRGDARFTDGEASLHPASVCLHASLHCSLLKIAAHNLVIIASHAITFPFAVLFIFLVSMKNGLILIFALSARSMRLFPPSCLQHNCS